MTKARTETARRANREHAPEQSAPVRAAEHLRDQVFAACGYALAIAAAATWLFAPGPGISAPVTMLVLTALSVPLNLLAIRRLARARQTRQKAVTKC